MKVQNLMRVKVQLIEQNLMSVKAQMILQVSLQSVLLSTVLLELLHGNLT
jgi:hypothetical protein